MAARGTDYNPAPMMQPNGLPTNGKMDYTLACHTPGPIEPGKIRRILIDNFRLKEEIIEVRVTSDPKSPAGTIKIEFIPSAVGTVGAKVVISALDGVDDAKMIQIIAKGMGINPNSITVPS